MATVTGFTAARMLGIENNTVVSGLFDAAGHLILTKHDGTQFDVGAMPAATTTLAGRVELATAAETTALTDAVRAITPAGLEPTITALDGRLDVLEALPGSKVQVLANNALAESATPTSYPTGISLMNLTTGSGWTPMSGFGTLVTYKVVTDRTYQTMYSSNGGTLSVQQWSRVYHSTTGGGGWTVWQPNQIVNNLVPASFTQATAFTSYPLGPSRLYYTTGNSTSWDFTGKAGEVVTYVDGTDFAKQIWIRHQSGAATVAEMWLRTANAASGWTAWRTVVFDDRVAKLPTAMASGTVNITPVANTPTSIGITFPAGRFASAPVVTVTAATTVPGTQVTGVGVSNITSSGCDIFVTRTNTTVTIMNWMAVLN